MSYTSTNRVVLVGRLTRFDVSVYGGQAENVARYTRRGGRVAVDGRLEWREWEAADGQRRQAVSIVADAVEFLDGHSERDREGEDGELAAVGGEQDEALA
jgi:single stranded DNA-binding protein